MQTVSRYKRFQEIMGGVGGFGKVGVVDKGEGKDKEGKGRAGSCDKGKGKDKEVKG